MHELPLSFMVRRQRVIWQIANATGAAEREFQRMVGADWAAAYKADTDIIGETIDMLTADDRPAVHLQPRTIRNPNRAV